MPSLPSGSYIWLTSSLDSALEELSDSLSGTRYKLFSHEEFLIDHSKEVIEQAHLASSEPWRIIIAAKSYNLYAQNALLKILEEPPARLSFTLLATSKSALLPTIRSRLPIVDDRGESPLEPFPLALSTLSLKESYEFLKELSRANPTKESTKRLIQSLLLACKESKIALKTSDLDLFNRAILLAEQFERPAHIFLPLFLVILQRKKHAPSKA